MSDTPAPPPPPAPRSEVKEHHLSLPRLFGIILLFIIACGDAVWKSDRFQGLLHRVSQSRLTEALGPPVTFNTVEIRTFPPTVLPANGRTGYGPTPPAPLRS